MKIIDISWPLNAAATAYKDRHSIMLSEIKTFERDGARETTLTLSCHSGTHVDAPAHFLKDGITIDAVSLNRLIGSCVMLNLETVDEAISREVLEMHAGEIKSGDIVLFRTANSLKNPMDKFWSQFIYLDASGAQYLVERGIKAVGIDYLGIERNQPDHDTHCILMHHDIAIIEGLRLAQVKPGRYEFVCLPLNVLGAEAAPARAILIER